ncbi:MAG: HAMP domain-containing sensor histidine kinase [candidate division Zixibacteria bacterium]|nr:HAMP domain-containing sensor histidine kinase [candidate division Zixibacteria bacterium]
MKLSPKTVRIIIALAIISLSGLVVLQGRLLYNALQTKEQTFRRNALAALNAASQALETSEAMNYSVQAFMATDDHQSQQRLASEFIRADDTICGDSLFVVTRARDTAPPVRIIGDTLYYVVRKPQKVMIQVYNPDYSEKRITVDTFKTAGCYTLCLDSLPPALNGYAYSYRMDGKSVIQQIETFGGQTGTFSDLLPGDGKKVLVQRVLSLLMDAERQPIEKRLDKKKLDSIITANLEENGIDLTHAFGIVTGAHDSLVLAEPADMADRLRTSEFRAQLFPQDLFSVPSELVLHFPGKSLYLWWQMIPMLLATVILMGIIIACFAYTTRIMVSQKRFAGRLIEFINNMTHEFKTPLSTVALASEAISRPDVASEPEKIAHFNRMIAGENLRMRRQVDKILQMAVLEEGDYELTVDEVDLHDVIRRAVENIALAVESRGGHIACELNAANPIVTADRVHMANIIHNLLDNANKYSPERPTINVATRNVADGVAVTIHDHGIGISEVDKKQVFDKYFRVSSGNRHDIKGFGLGLSYVKLMVEAHGGRIDLHSRLGEGTTVELFLPFGGPEEIRT